MMPLLACQRRCGCLSPAACNLHYGACSGRVADAGVLLRRPAGVLLRPKIEKAAKHATGWVADAGVLLRRPLVADVGVLLRRPHGNRSSGVCGLVVNAGVLLFRTLVADAGVRLR